MVARMVERVERAAQFPTQGHPVHEYPEEPLKEVHESPYRIIYDFSEEEFRVVTIVHFKQRLEKRAEPGELGDAQPSHDSG
jgi:plasmid stabilization system protein ParE